MSSLDPYAYGILKVRSGRGTCLSVVPLTDVNNVHAIGQGVKPYGQDLLGPRFASKQLLPGVPHTSRAPRLTDIQTVY